MKRLSPALLLMILSAGAFGAVLLADAQPLLTDVVGAVAQGGGTVAARSEAGAGETLPVNLSADQLDYNATDQLFKATGSVQLQQGEMTLAARELFWQEPTRDAMASGEVQLTEPTGELQASSLHANLATGRGLARDGRVLLRGENFHLAGAEIERLGEASFRVADGRFTTCDGDHPDWQFVAKEIKVDLGRYAVARDVWFEVGEQPVFYLPYLLFPVKSERESGFLLPRAGYSSRKGALLSLSWYQVIDRHLDATIYLDYLSKIGLGKGLEYRYVLDGGSQGEALLYHVSGFDGAPDSYAIKWQHEGTLPGGGRLAADIEYVNREEFFEDFGEGPEEYNRDWTISTLLAQRNWGKLNLTGYARYINDLDADNDTILQIFPELGLDVPYFRLDDSPVYTRTELRATNFSRKVGDEGGRLFLRQAVGLTLKPGSWLELNPEVALYGRAYDADSGSESDLLPEYSVALSTRLQRVFTVQRWGIERIQHSIEPEIRYVYIPERDQDELPMFDRMDRIGPLNQVECALINRLVARLPGMDGVPVYRELLNLRLSQAYALDDEWDAVAGSDPRSGSDLRTELTLRPSARSFLEIDALTKVHDELKFSRFRAGAGYNDGHGNQFQVDYRYLTEAAFTEPTDYLQAELTTSRFAPLHLKVAERYDFSEGGSLETAVGLEYRAKCWSLFVTFRDRPGSEEVLVGFSLSGLGGVGGFDNKLRSVQERP